MMTPADHADDEMSDYLQMFTDETEEQLEGLVEALLVLENDVDDAEAINEAFRLIHSIKGSAGMMGFENIALLTHHLESRFELFRSRTMILDQPTMNLVLRCIDFLRECVGRMRAGEALGPIGPLLDDLKALEQSATPAAVGPGPKTPAAVAARDDARPAAPAGPPTAVRAGQVRVLVHFEPGLALVDLKARLVHSRLSRLGDVLSTTPPLTALESIGTLERFELVLATEAPGEQLRAAADADGITSVEIQMPSATPAPAAGPDPVATEPAPAAPAPSREETTPLVPGTAAVASRTRPTTETSATRLPSTETMRVDVDRLDELMNLAGELVVNRARFVQISERVTPALRSRNAVGRAREFTESLRRTITQLKDLSQGNGAWRPHIEGLETGLAFVEEQSDLWENGRRSFMEIGEAIDQLTRISDSLQRSALGTRMVPVAPLFNRFRRVVRDLSADRGKKVLLEIHGEKTELDKRMIDELGDPLVHLVRNSIDHGLESPDVRVARGKPEAGTIRLEARHSGNSVFIDISDDGGGIDVERIRAKVLERGLLGAEAAAQLTDAQALEYIWHPGFSTAQRITDISGRGVGMDAVRTRITELNGMIDVDTTPAQGTVFTIRLPLTLAIIHSLLMRIRGVMFSMPIEDVREIVSVSPSDVVSVHGRETLDVRGQFIPLVAIDDVFEWNAFDQDAVADEHAGPASSPAEVRAVVLQTGGKTMALRVDDLVGSDDLVIKSLSQNFMHIQGLSGASILGDGTVCLMLDVSSVIDRAIKAASAPRTLR